MIILSHILPVALASSCQLNNKGWWWPPPPLIHHPPTRVQNIIFSQKLGKILVEKTKCLCVHNLNVPVLKKGFQV